jgi:hypothetical protein
MRLMLFLLLPRSTVTEAWGRRRKPQQKVQTVLRISATDLSIICHRTL